MCGAGSAARTADVMAIASAERRGPTNELSIRFQHPSALLGDGGHMISFKRPPIFTPSAAVGVARTTRPWG